MNREDRKAAITAYKARKPVLGIYAVICEATGETWVGLSQRVDTQRNRLWFALRHASSPHRSLQAAWTLHGETAFRFEELDRLGDDVPAFSRLEELKRRLSLWRARLQGAAL
jgi:hypothetical protein